MRRRVIFWSLFAIGCAGFLAGQKAGWASPHKSTKTAEQKAELKKTLTPLQYYVTQENGTERAYRNEYWDNKKQGIYVDVVSGEALFSSLHKFKSGTGWPSFWKAIEEKGIVEIEDNTLFMKRIEVRSKNSDSHLGHLFNDGPKPTGLRYCLNSASLRFVPVSEFKNEGLTKYLPLFEKKKEAPAK